MLTAHEGGDTWDLSDGASLHDVTHLPCRSARYKPLSESKAGSPENAQEADFPVTPGGLMPPVAGCSKQDYWVLFVVGVDDK